MSSISDQGARRIASAHHATDGEDIWRAAMLLVGVYGEHALGHAMTRFDQESDSDKAQTWELIVIEVQRLLSQPPPRTLQ